MENAELLQRIEELENRLAELEKHALLSGEMCPACSRPTLFWKKASFQESPALFLDNLCWQFDVFACALCGHKEERNKRKVPYPS